MQLTQIQIWLLLVSSCTAYCLVAWAVFIVIPNRNETITFLKDRNQTLEYWINNITLEKTHSPWVANLRGTDPEKNLQSLLKEHEWLNDQLRKCLINIEHCNTALNKEKSNSHEQQ
jgi:hypothetical protein